jgi:hypothetical protein
MSASSDKRCRLIVFDQSASAVLVRSTGPLRHLPEIPVSPGARLIEHVSRNLLEKRTQAICLFTLNSMEPVTYVVAEYQTTSCSEKESGFQYFTWCGSTTDLEVADRNAVSRARQQLHEASNSASHKPFMRLGWFGELLDWIHSLPGAARPTGVFLQFNASASFSLIRFETADGAVWFKAVGPPNLRELPITTELAALFPSRVPKLIALKSEWNAWLSEEATGRPLSDCEQASWELAAQSLSSLQIDSQASVSRLLALGARDLRICKLKLLLTPFLCTMGRLFAEENEDSRSNLSEKDIQTLGARIRSALEKLEQVDVPDCLGHLDPNPGNFIVASDSCRILDWAEAYVGHPFLTFEYLRQYHLRVNRDPGCQADLCTAYYSKWICGFDSEVLLSATRLIPFLAVFVYAAACEDWAGPRLRQIPGRAAYYRSLLHRMWRLSPTLNNLSTL